jgi:hypothetical protein
MDPEADTIRISLPQPFPPEKLGQPLSPEFISEHMILIPVGCELETFNSEGLCRSTLKLKGFPKPAPPADPHHE